MPWKEITPERAERHRQARRDHYQRNKERYLERARQTEDEIRAYLREVKSAPCADCGQSYPHYVMDLDHRPGEVKLCGPTSLPRSGSMKKAIAEVAKCDVVCANCHRERTARRAGYAEELPVLAPGGAGGL